MLVLNFDLDVTKRNRNMFDNVSLIPKIRQQQLLKPLSFGPNYLAEYINLILH